MLLGAVACLLVAQIIGIVGLKTRLHLTASLTMIVFLSAALTLGVVGGLQFLPNR